MEDTFILGSWAAVGFMCVVRREELEGKLYAPHRKQVLQPDAP